jgi:hypothetical protein
VAASAVDCGGLGHAVELADESVDGERGVFEAAGLRPAR